MQLRFDQYVIDGTRRELWHGAEPVAIEPQVFDLSRNDEAIAWLEKARVNLATAALQTSDLSASYSWLAAAYALKGDTSRAGAELAQARNAGDYPKSLDSFCGPGHWCANPDVKTVVAATYYKGPRLVGWSEH